MVSPHGTDSSRGWKEGVSTPATLMRLAAGAGREAQERTSIVHEAGTLIRLLDRDIQTRHDTSWTSICRSGGH